MVGNEDILWRGYFVTLPRSLFLREVRGKWDTSTEDVRMPLSS